ncbi:cytochrome oxidase putative small subunit CydP [Pseudomonas panipatensis]|uniref:Uncharacterized protein n=1 Tax=Pseudomonas panipatensis TaxID=428992 RepID=A0A1G8FKR4_9PSED|nr:cytochrome oxidase putative small subunit CydP [Pseudomonas panipatensis]SDH82616.1 hypothetical protein SAMN05216272_103301 [Pseudomonas panipatensis]SMP53156.1 hypothetical protein SAMN06295951_103158 [Pseudomonas panipatensis]
MPPEVNSPWKIPLVREIAVILLIKLVLLMAIKVIWFDTPSASAEQPQQVFEHLLGSAPTPPNASPKENPR